jgi:hypothetical protein
MGQEDSELGESSTLKYLVVASRILPGLIGCFFLILFFGGWLLLETLVALVAFPIAAVLFNQRRIKQSWLGRFPIAMRAFSCDRFKYVRTIWEWVRDPAQAIDLETKLSGKSDSSATNPTSTKVTPLEQGSSAEPTKPATADSSSGCLWLFGLIGITILVIAALVKGCG